MLKRIFIALFSLICMLVVITNYFTVQSAAKQAVGICINSVFPSVFPFLILSSMIIKSGSASVIGKPFSRIFNKFFGVNKSCTTPIILGLTAGFPVGASCTYNLYKNGEISKDEAEYLLSFCSNSGISFIFGIIGGEIFKSAKIGAMIFVIQLVSSVITGVLMKNRHIISVSDFRTKNTDISFSAVVVNSVKESVINIAYICGYIVLFSIFTKLIISFLPECFSFTVKGILELTSASYELSYFELKSAFVLACGILSWCGICVHMQVRAVTGNLSLKPYFIGKAVHMALSMLMAYLTPITSSLSVYKENISIVYRNNGFGFLFVIIFFIVMCCILFKSVVK